MVPIVAGHHVDLGEDDILYQGDQDVWLASPGKAVCTLGGRIAELCVAMANIHISPKPLALVDSHNTGSNLQEGLSTGCRSGSFHPRLLPPSLLLLIAGLLLADLLLADLLAGHLHIILLRTLLCRITLTSWNFLAPGLLLAQFHKPTHLECLQETVVQVPGNVVGVHDAGDPVQDLQAVERVEPTLANAPSSPWTSPFNNLGNSCAVGWRWDPSVCSPRADYARPLSSWQRIRRPIAASYLWR